MRTNQTKTNCQVKRIAWLAAAYAKQFSKNGLEHELGGRSQFNPGSANVFLSPQTITPFCDWSPIE